jgi:hypothetical protein
MFDRIAGVYDAMNSVMTAGLHHRWRERAADLARLEAGDRALDVATGTGDLALALARRVGPAGEVVAAAGGLGDGSTAAAATRAPRGAARAASAPGSPAVAGSSTSIMVSSPTSRASCGGCGLHPRRLTLISAVAYCSVWQNE